MEPPSPWRGSSVNRCWCVCLLCARVVCFRSSDKVHLREGPGSQFQRYHSNQTQTEITWSERGSHQDGQPPKKVLVKRPRSQHHSCWIFHGVWKATKPTVKFLLVQRGALVVVGVCGRGGGAHLHVVSVASRGTFKKPGQRWVFAHSEQANTRMSGKHTQMSFQNYLPWISTNSTSEEKKNPKHVVRH